MNGEPLHNGKIALNGIEYDSPLDSPYPKRLYSEGKESARISFRKIWLDRYIFDSSSRLVEYWSSELKLLSNGKCLIDGREIRNEREANSVKIIFDGLKIE